MFRAVTSEVSAIDYTWQLICDGLAVSISITGK